MSRGARAYHNGMAAEDIAARAYEARGGQVLARRWKVAEGEIDLIVALDGMTVFAEVKARKTLESAMQAISPHQQARLLACAAQYLAGADGPDSDCRFDLVAIDRNGRIKILENVLMG